MRKFLLVVWLVSLTAMLFLFGYIRLHGVTPDRTDLAGYIGMVLGGSFAVWAGMMWKAKRQAIIAHLSERRGFYVVISLILFFVIVLVTHFAPGIRIWEAKREFRASPFFGELSAYDPIAYQRFESQYVEIIRSGGTQQKAYLNLVDELMMVMPKYMPKASDESVLAFGRQMVASLEELGRANSDACYSFLFPHKFGDSELVKKNISLQSGEKTLQVLQGIIVSAVKNPQPAPDEKKADELLQPILRNVIGTYGSDVKLFGGTAINGPERKKVCEMVTEFHREIQSLPPAEASTVLRSVFSVKPAPQEQ